MAKHCRLDTYLEVVDGLIAEILHDHRAPERWRIRGGDAEGFEPRGNQFGLRSSVLLSLAVQRTKLEPEQDNRGYESAGGSEGAHHFGPARASHGIDSGLTLSAAADRVSVIGGVQGRESHRPSAVRITRIRQNSPNTANTATTAV
jgi:hypothetical protein